jgi:plasmid stability protein
MAQLLVRDIKPETINRLKDRAKQHNRSLQGEAKLILEEAAQKMTMEEFKARAQKWRKRLAGGKFSDSAELIREDRDR